MSITPQATEEREALLGELFSKWLEALESGQRPNREDWLAQYPEYASELEEWIAEEERMRSIAAPLRAAAQAALLDTPVFWETFNPSTPKVEHPLGAFGDFELLEEIGRGGMAVVYRAKQKGLDRFVALKLFRSDRLGRVTDLERFRHEAQIVAQLDHPLIVPIYEVGEHDGCFYFTMKLLEGGSLDTQLGRFREKPREVATLTAEVARAIHHAHQRGILHRDLKPSNILLSGAGEQLVPNVSDFGLAKRLDADMSLTQTGAVVGTPAYMAPEQAVSERNAITTATDVYGLGAVLYALLAGKAPFRGDSIFDTLTQVKEREPERPRSANANVPRDLETICLKCLQKEPQRRYESAAALADDLQRWLNGEPITARPVGRTERLWRWCRRQPIQAALAAGLILAVACGFILVFWQWRRAEDNLEASNKSNREANQATQQAQERQLEADENFLLAHDAVKDVTAILESSGELERRGLDPLRRDLLLKAQSYYRKFLERRQHDPALKKELAQASATLADILRQTGTAAEAIEAYEQALLHCEALLNDQPDNLITRLAQAELNNQLSSVYGSINRQDRSVEYLKTAQKIVDECLKLQPEDTNLIVRAAVMVQNIGVSHAAAGRSDNALKCYAQTKKTLERLAANDPYNERFQESLAHVLFAIGSEHTARGESTEALNAFREAVEKSEALANRHPQQRKLAHAFAQQLCFLADCLLGREEPKEALSHLLRAQEILADLTRANAAMTEYQVTMGLCCSMIATASVEVNELKQADEAVQKARSIFSRLMKDFPDVPDYPYRLIWVLINMARGHEKLKHLQKANDIYEEAEDLSTRLVNRHSNDSRYEFQLGEVLHNLAVVQSGLGRPGDARELILKALKSEQKLFDKQPGNTRARLRLSLNYSLLASLNRDLGFFNEAIDAIQKRHKLWPNSPTELYDVAEDYAITSAASKADINLQKRCADLALEALRQAIQAGFHDFKNAQANPNLAVLRSRPEFQQILAEMNKKP